jgi:hypothetical protein
MPHRQAIFLLFMSVVATQLPAQASTPRIPANATTLTVGIGGGEVGAGFEAALTHRRGMHDLTVRGIATAQIQIFGGRTRSVGDLGVMYGIHPIPNRNAFAARVGIGAVWYQVDPGGSAPRRDYGPRTGIPWELSVVAPFSDIMGVGLSVLGNVNSLRSYGVVMLTLHLGRLRREAN